MKHIFASKINFLMKHFMYKLFSLKLLKQVQKNVYYILNRLEDIQMYNKP